MIIKNKLDIEGRVKRALLGGIKAITFNRNKLALSLVRRKHPPGFQNILVCLRKEYLFNKKNLNASRLRLLSESINERIVISLWFIDKFCLVKIM